MGITCRVLLFIHEQWSKGVCDTQIPSTGCRVVVVGKGGVESTERNISNLCTGSQLCREPTGSEEQAWKAMGPG